MFKKKMDVKHGEKLFQIVVKIGINLIE